MFFISLPSTAKIGDTVDCTINGEAKQVTYKDAATLVIEPGDARRILQTQDDGTLIAYVCSDAVGEGGGGDFVAFSPAPGGKIRQTTLHQDGRDPETEDIDPNA
jgi:hypothetical protein